MSAQRFAIIDPATGVSGDMLLGALVALGAPVEWLVGLPSRLGLNDVEIQIDRVMRASIAATKVTVRLAGATEGPGDVSLADHEHHHGPGDIGSHSHHHHHGGGDATPDSHQHQGGTQHQHSHNGHPHRHVEQLLEMIARAPLSSWVRERAMAAFRLLANAEGRVHGVPPEDVALHEVGALDALVDIVGVIEGFEQLGVTTIYARPLALGNGWVRTAHGLLPVPAPATALLVEELEVAPNGPVSGEATTPTGAALLRVLSNGPASGTWRPIKTGWGAGGRNPDGYPNALRVVLADPRQVGPLGGNMVALATDLDDLSPEYLEPLREALTQAGAVDVQSWATQSKKGRIGFRVEALAPESRVDAVVDAFFRHSSTAGVRRWDVERATLAREQWELASRDGSRVRIKTLHGPTGPRVKPEYDDVVEIARRTGQPAVELSRKYGEEALRQIDGRQKEAHHEQKKESPE